MGDVAAEKKNILVRLLVISSAGILLGALIDALLFNRQFLGYSRDVFLIAVAAMGFLSAMVLAERTIPQRDITVARSVWWTIVAALVVFFAFLYAYPYFITRGQGLPSSDSVNIAILAEQWVHTSAIQPFWMGGAGYSPYISEPASIYVPLQFIVAIFFALTPLSLWTSFGLAAVLITMSIVVGTGVVTYKIWESRWLALAASLFAATNLAIARSLVLTVQNMFGYLFLLAVLYFVVSFIKKNRWRWLMIAVLLLLATYWVHTLSFVVGVLSMSVWGVGAIPRMRDKWYAVLFGGVLLVLGGIFYMQDYRVWIFFTDFFIDAGVIAPHFYALKSPLELMPTWGYFLSLFGVLGLAALWKNNRKIAWLLLAWAVTPFMLTQTSLLGFAFLPDRFGAYVWIALVLAAPIGLQTMIRGITHPWVRGGVVFLVFLSSTIHFVAHMQSDLRHFGPTFFITSEITEAFQWLGRNVPEGETVLTQSYGNYDQVIYIPHYYNGKVARLLEDAVAVEKKKDTFFLQKKGLLGLLASDEWYYDQYRQSQKDATPKAEHVLAEMFLHPGSAESQTYYRDFRISTVLVFRGTTESVLMEEHARNGLFNKRFSNALITIYEKE